MRTVGSPTRCRWRLRSLTTSAWTGHGRLLDVGCGPGSLTLLLAPLFDQAVGLDPDPDMLEPGGACVLVHATTHQGAPGRDPLANARPPREEITELVHRYLGPVRRAGRRSLSAGTPSGEDDILRAAGFVRSARLEVGGGAAFEADLRDLLRSVSPRGEFSERTQPVALDVWRPRA